MSRTSRQGQSRTPARQPPSRWRKQDSRTRSGWSVCSARRYAHIAVCDPELPADLELQLAVPTTVYHWLQAFHDLRWTGKPDRQIGPTHWQEWLQADAQGNTIRGIGPAPATRHLDASAPGRALALHTVPLAKLPFDPALEGAIRKSVPLSPSRGATEPKKCSLCAENF